MERREIFRKGLHALYLPFYDSLCDVLSDDWQPYCGLRSPAIQLIDFENKTSNAMPWQSPHQYGMASDWTMWDGSKPQWLKKEDKAWSEYIQACEKVGVKCGNTWGDYYHNEFRISVSWKKAKGVYDQYGIDRAIQFIKQVHCA